MQRCTFQPVSGDDDERKVQDIKTKREEEIRRRRRRRRMKRDGEFSDQGGVEKIFAARMLQNLCLCQSIKQCRSSGKD
jgi:hypothetical protein